jgi:hypothetical protein
MKIAMKQTTSVVAAFLVAVTFSAPVMAQDDDMEPKPILDPTIDFKDVDLNGTWNFEISKPTVSGRCPAGDAVAGTAEITQQGTAVTLRYTSGARCRPAAVCSYTGALHELDQHAVQFVVTNAVDVDDEGGMVSSAIRLDVISNEHADGSATNEYHHPEGFECRWNMFVTLTRDLDEADDEGGNKGEDKKEVE